MAKMFYTAKEATERLGVDEAGLKDLVRKGKLREFRDAGEFNYKVEDVDAIAPAPSPSAPDSEVDAASASASGDIVLEPAEDSSVELTPSGSDVVSLDEGDAEDTTSGTKAAKKAKEDTVVPSVGVNVFDDDELDEHVDPLAQTAVTDVAGLGIEGIGSGSGILDLTRESDDTSLGADLIEEIYSGEEEEEEGAVEMGEKTRAGLDEAVPDKAAEGEGDLAVEAEAEQVAAPPQPQVAVKQVVEYAPDAVSAGLTALLIVAVVVMWFAGLAAASLVRGITPALLQFIYSKLWMCAAGALVAAVIAAGVTYFMAKRSR